MSRHRESKQHGVQHLRIASAPSLCLADGDRPSTYAARYYLTVRIVGTNGNWRDAPVVADIVRHRRQPGELPELIAYVSGIGKAMPVTFAADYLRQIGGDQPVLDTETLDKIVGRVIEAYLNALRRESGYVAPPSLTARSEGPG